MLPMVFDADDDPDGTLRGHLARPNPQWRDPSPTTDALAILDGPDAYVSPTWYETKRRTGRDVPTGNHVAVHASYGALMIHHDHGWGRSHGH